MSNVQFSLFGNVKISEILSEIQAIHKAFYYLCKDEEDKDYQVYRYPDGDILLCVYRKKQSDKETREKILEETFVALGYGQAALSTGVIASFSWAYRIYLIKEIKKESQNGKQDNN